MADQGIIHFKETLNLLIPEFTALGKNPVLTTNDNPLESSFMQGLGRSVGTAQEKIKSPSSPALTAFLATDRDLANKVMNLQTSGFLDRETIDVFRTLNARIDEGKLTGLDAGTKTMITSMASIANDFESLGADSKEKINTSQKLFRRTDAGNSASNTQQARALLDLNRRYLGLEPSTSDPAKSVAGAHVEEKLALALREQMKELKKQNPEADFEPLRFDQKAVTFLKSQRDKQIKEAGVDQSNLNQTLLNLWIMQNAGKTSGASSTQSELGKTSALLSAMEYMVDGKLSGGTYASRPTVENTWDKGWTDNKSPDHFFNQKVYQELMDPSQKNPGEVKVSTLLAVTGDTRQNSNLDKAIEKLRQDLKDPTKLDNAKQISSMIDQIDRYKRDPKYDTTLTKEQIGILAIEILAQQAKDLCIDEKDVNKAIRSGKLSPHLADLSLVDDGLGTPQKLKNANDRAGEELAYRSEKFANRFGTMSTEQSGEAAKQIQRLNSTLDTNWINANHQSPINTYKMFSIMSGRTENSPDAAYKVMRERYLLDLSERLQKSGCAVDAKPALSASASAPAAGGAATIPPTGGANTATAGSGSDPGCVAGSTAGPCAPEKPSATSQGANPGCVAGSDASGCKSAFSGASSDRTASSSDMVSSNIVDTTGSAAAPLPEAHTLPLPQNKTPAATSGAP